MVVIGAKGELFTCSVSCLFLKSAVTFNLHGASEPNSSTLSHPVPSHLQGTFFMKAIAVSWLALEEFYKSRNAQIYCSVWGSNTGSNMSSCAAPMLILETVAV